MNFRVFMFMGAILNFVIDRFGSLDLRSSFSGFRCAIAHFGLAQKAECLPNPATHSRLALGEGSTLP
jgi:hypothetical protein